MKSFFLIVIGTLIATFCFSFFILFEGNAVILKSWWQEVVRDSETLPYSPYKSRIVAKPDLITKPANQIVIEDQHLFWKGTGATVKPILNQNGMLKNIAIHSNGKGYSNLVHAKVIGAGADLFELGKPKVYKGSIQNIPIIKSAKWNEESVVYAKDDRYPLSGIVVNKFPSGQIIEQSQYLSGKLHGTLKRWNEYGIPLCSKDYLHGKKHGTHIYWFDQANDPDDYRPSKNKNGEIIPTLWIKLREEARDNFKDKFGTHKANEWVIFKYRTQGGDFPVRILEHWRNNNRHGLFEGFDRFGNKTFKDEYKNGLRMKHKIFDKTKG